jgi:dsRNA-specific ribonuclease
MTLYSLSIKMLEPVMSIRHLSSVSHQEKSKNASLMSISFLLFIRKAEIISPYDDKIPGNPIGTLQEMCMSRRWPPPGYEMVNEEGLPHERLFTIACVVFKHRETG